jgi:hypothetical protein
MDWQQMAALSIVAATVALFVASMVRRRGFRWERDTACGCAAAGGTAPRDSIVFRARKGERPEIRVKMK